MPGGGKLDTLNLSALSESKSKGKSLLIAEDSLAKQKKAERDFRVGSLSWLQKMKNKLF